jgi:hypothetical protein
LERIGLSSLYGLFRLHEYIGSVVCSTRGRNITTTPASTSNTLVTPLTSAHRVDALQTPDNKCQSSDDSEDAFLGQIILDFADEAIDAVLSEQSTNARSDLMNGQWCASMTRHTNEERIVPQLPAPNVHTRNTVWPNDMKSLVTFKGSFAFDVVKGIKSLNLELTWRQASFP